MGGARVAAGLAAVLCAVVASTAQAAPGAAASCALSPALGGLPAADGAARAGQREPSAWKNPPIEEAPDAGPGFSATIPVYFHVFTDGAEGRLSATALQQQISVLNAGFAGREGGYATGFRFTYAGVDYTDNATWFRALDPGTSVERAAKAATHVGGADVLNVWTTDGPSYLGFATFPSWYKRSPQLDGVVVDYKSFPGGSYGSQYSLGKTATHEVGHWLGLLHTFQGACNAKGDYVDDTPPEATPTSGCPAGKDTCKAPGTDPIHNYMDYSYDSCYDRFTAGQAKRMQDQFAYFRRGGGSSVGN
jgi:Pregnancy-associated plasma protein-A